MIMIDEVIRIDKEDESRNNVEEHYKQGGIRISLSRVRFWKQLNHLYTKFFVRVVEIKQLQYTKIDTVENDVKLKDGIIDIEVEKINIKEVDIASEEWPKSNEEDENIIDKENTFMCMTNEESVTELIAFK